MKPITEQESQDLIEWIPEHIEYLKSTNSKSTYARLNIAALEIAMASLNSKVAFEVTRSIISSCGDHSIASKLVGGTKGLVNGDVPKYLYTAPPVPVIELPSYVTDKEGNVDEFSSGFNMAIDAVKHLNGIK